MENSSFSSSLFTEVPALPTSVCWKCHGSGTKLVKVSSLISNTSVSSLSSVSPILPSTTLSHHQSLTVLPNVQSENAKNTMTNSFTTVNNNNNQTTIVSCPICKGTGSLERKRKRPLTGIDRPVKEFPGWIMVGPVPYTEEKKEREEEEKQTTTDAVTKKDTQYHAKYKESIRNNLNDVEVSYLTGKWRILQADTHKYSTDDVVTAWVAWRTGRILRQRLSTSSTTNSTIASSGIGRILDMGCGIGSVLLMNAWLHPHVDYLRGIEAQISRYNLTQRNIEYNCGPHCNRIQVINGDLRNVQVLIQQYIATNTTTSVASSSSPDTVLPLSVSSSSSSSSSLFDLVTGTPPYFLVEQGGMPQNEEAARCLFEYRGGIEAYCKAAKDILAPYGLFIVCGAGIGFIRGYNGAKEANLTVLGRIDCVPKMGKPPLFIVYIMCHQGKESYFGWKQKDSSIPLEQPVNASGDPISIDPLTIDIFNSSLPINELVYPDMRTPAYQTALVERCNEKIQPRSVDARNSIHDNDKEDNTNDNSDKRTFPKRNKKSSSNDKNNKNPSLSVKQEARGLNVQYMGKPYLDNQEIVHTVIVRNNVTNDRTEEYKRLLWELGKPG